MSQLALIQRKIAFAQDTSLPASGDAEDVVMIFDATLSEHHDFEIAITENPVETGVSMADHAYAKPDRLTIEVAVSDTPMLAHQSGDPPGVYNVTDLAVSQGLLYSGSGRRSVSAWGYIKRAAKSFQVFTIQTGLELYQNMMFETGSAEQKVDSGGILKATINLHQVTFATTSTVVYPPRAKPVKRKAAPPEKVGDQEAIDAANEASAAVHNQAQAQISILSQSTGVAE